MQANSVISTSIIISVLWFGVLRTTGLDDPQEHYERAVSQHQSGDLNAAIVEYRRALSLNPDHFLAHRGLGVALAERGDIAPSIGEFRELVRIKPNSGEAHSLLGLALARAGNVKEGISEAKRGLSLEPDSDDSYSALLILLASKGDRAAFLRLLGSGSGTNMSFRHPINCQRESTPQLVDSGGSKGAYRISATFKAEPEYPAVAKVFNLFGKVQLRAVTGREGRLEDVQPVAGHPVLVKAALGVVACWQSLGIPDATPIEIEINYRSPGGERDAGAGDSTH